MAKFARKSSKTPVISREDRRLARQAKRRGESNVFDLSDSTRKVSDKQEPLNKEPIQYRTQAQADYHGMMQTNTYTFGIGPAGTGKSHVAINHGAIMLMEGKIKYIVVTRPAVECGPGIGFLPGEVDDKSAPYFAPIRAMLEKRLGVGYTEYLIKAGRITFTPLGFLRGTTFDDTFIMLDEAQNVTVKEMKTFLTRAGKNCTMVIDGDTDQVDIKEPSGLEDAVKRLHGMRGLAVQEFTIDDIVRNPLIKELLRRYGKSKVRSLLNPEPQEETTSGLSGEVNTPVTLSLVERAKQAFQSFKTRFAAA